MQARATYRERKNYHEGIQKNTLPRPPRNHARDQMQVKLWKKLIAYEKRVIFCRRNFCTFFPRDFNGLIFFPIEHTTSWRGFRQKTRHIHLQSMSLFPLQISRNLARGGTVSTSEEFRRKFNRNRWCGQSLWTRVESLWSVVTAPLFIRWFLGKPRKCYRVHHPPFPLNSSLFVFLSFSFSFFSISLP